MKKLLLFGLILLLCSSFATAFNFEGVGVTILSPLESNGAIPVNIRDQTTLALNLNFIQALGVPTFLQNDVFADGLEINVTNTSGFVDGVFIGIFSGEGFFYFGEQMGSVIGNTVTLDTPLDNNFSSVTSQVLRFSRELAVDGSITTQVFQIGPIGEAQNVELDITRIMGYLQDGSSMDDSLFGGLPALSNGVVFRKNNGVFQNFWNAKSNGDLALLTFDFSYTSRAPSGSFGARFRNSYAGQEKHGVTIRLEPGDILEILIQDDLSGLESFRMMAQGHVVTS